MREYHFPLYKSDEEKEKFYDEYKRIKDTYKSVDFRWDGDYSVATYEDVNGNRVELWDNAELGICHSIVYLDEDKKVEGVETNVDKVHFPLSDEDRITYYDKTIKLGQSMNFEIYKIGDKYYDVYGTEVDENGNDLNESKEIMTEAKITDYISEEELDNAIKGNAILNLYDGYDVVEDMYLVMHGRLSNPIYKVYRDENTGSYMAYYSTEKGEKLGDEFVLVECKKITESTDTQSTSIPEINIIIEKFEELYEKHKINKEDLVNNGEIFYMNGNMGTDGDWKDNLHLSYFMSFYKDTEKGFAKVTLDKDGTLYGCYYPDNGNGNPVKIDEEDISNEESMEEIAALLFEQADEIGLFNAPLHEINLDAKVESLNYDWLYDEDSEDDYEDDYEEYDEDEEDWNEEDEYYESFHKKVQEAKEDNMTSDGDIFDERDRAIFQSLKNQKEDKTVFDLLQDRIGVPMTVGDLNTALKNIFSKHDEVFLLESMLYNADIDEPQDLVIWDDDDMYTITFDIKDIEEGTIEITDVNLE
ncbi:hypothetical protein [uncultured Clostridium sp.]|uniref:hypothetical protein n=1 Tax=uncultured Clostridium sp. TaxID=59620 RepID=UPI0026E9C784|nr:hypothetical protein [uncultured Clostridium sp.]